MLCRYITFNLIDSHVVRATNSARRRRRAEKSDISGPTLSALFFARAVSDSPRTALTYFLPALSLCLRAFSRLDPLAAGASVARAFDRSLLVSDA